MQRGIAVPAIARLAPAAPRGDVSGSPAARNRRRRRNCGSDAAASVAATPRTNTSSIGERRHDRLLLL
jgi:hypothetical protein